MEPMAFITLSSEPVTTIGELPAVGEQAPAFELVGSEMNNVTLDDFAGKRVVLNIFPSLDTGICATSVRKFNELAAGLEDTVVLSVSKDLPYAHNRFCTDEGIENVVSTSAFRSSFGDDYGVTMTDGKQKGLLARSIVVLDKSGKVIYNQQVPEIKTEPDYEAAIAALN